MNTHRTLIVVSVIGFFVVLGAAIGGAPVLVRALDLLPRQEKVTELYLLNYQDIPKGTVPNPLKFSFVIGNHEGTETLYRYKVYAVHGGIQEPIDEGEVSVAADEKKVINESFSTKATAIEIYIELQDRINAVHFSIPKPV